LRYERVKNAQQLGVDNRDMWHKLDYTKPIKAEEVKLPFALWLWSHDARKYAHEHFDEALSRAHLPSNPAKPIPRSYMNDTNGHVEASITPAVQSAAVAAVPASA